MKDMTLQTIAAVLDGTLYLKGDDKEIQGVVTDHREMQEDGLFIPLKGARVDGHTFINDAFERGAMCVLSEHELKEPKGSYILVESTLQSLRRLAAFYRTRLFIPIIGVIGSVGKTGTKEMISAVLSQRFHVLYTKGNLNNEIGLPLTMLSIKPEHDVAVCEMGISDFHEMDRLGAIAQPDMVVFTNVKECHLEALHDRQGVLKAKSEIFDHVLDGAGIFLNTDDDMLHTIHEIPNARRISFGTESQMFHAKQIIDEGLDGIRATICTPSFEEDILIHLPGKHNIYHALAAVAVGEYMGLTKEEIVSGIESVKAVGGRSHVIQVSENLTVIDDCYNASPASMNAALELLAQVDGEKIAVLGDMGELGENEKELHYSIGTNAAFKKIDRLFVAGELSAHIVKAVTDKVYPCQCKSFDTKEELLDSLKRHLSEENQTHRTVLIKASHFMNYAMLVDALLKAYQ